MNNSQKIWHALSSNRVDKIAYLPCNKLNALVRHVPDTMSILNITRESTGLGLCFGRSLAGKRSALMIQNTGLGNMITELYTLQKLYQEALPIFVSWRGHYQEPIEAQRIFGSKIEDLLQAIDVEYQIVESGNDLADLESSVGDCFEQKKVKVYLLSPQVWETNSADFHVFGAPQLNPVTSSVEGYQGQPTLIRHEAIDVILKNVKEEDIVVPQIGFPAKEAYGARDRAANFYMLGALGSATEVGIGLAMERLDRHVYVIDGDGSFFFNPNQFLDLATMAPDNVSVICLDNGSWGSTGNQPTLSAKGVNLSAMAQSVGISSWGMTDDPNKLASMMQSRIKFIHFFINAGNDKNAKEIPLSALEIKERFMESITC